ncbi:hypothetical protein Paride_0439 [Pseudomonas phage Paride]|nr:hypothetical protein Paride_0439 [Pseudomonas phage Paride]
MCLSFRIIFVSHFCNAVEFIDRESYFFFCHFLFLCLVTVKRNYLTCTQYTNFTVIRQVKYVEKYPDKY